MQDGMDEGFIGKVNDEEKDNPRGLATTDAAPLLSNTKSFRDKTMYTTPVIKISYTIKPKKEEISIPKESFHLGYRLGNHNKQIDPAKQKTYKNSMDTKGMKEKGKEAFYDKRNYIFSPINNDKSYLDVGLFSKAIAQNHTSQDSAYVKNDKGYNERSTLLKTKMQNNTSKTEYNGRFEEYVQTNGTKTKNSSYYLFPHNVNSTLPNTSLKHHKREKITETWRQEKISKERSRKPRKQSLNLHVYEEKPNNGTNGNTENDDGIYVGSGGITSQSVLGSKLHEVKVLPPKDFLDRMRGDDGSSFIHGPSTNLATAQKKIDKETVDLMKLFIDHTDDFELDDREITDLKRKANAIESQIYKRNLVHGVNYLEGKREPKLSEILLNKLKDAKKVSKWKTWNNNEKNSLEEKKLLHMDKSYNSMNIKKGSPIMNSSEQTIQPRFSSLISGSLNGYEVETSILPQERMFNPPPVALANDAFSSFLSHRPSPPDRHFEKFRKNSYSSAPTLTSIPPTLQFSCTDTQSDIKRTAGYYADPETRCQVM